MHWLPCCPQLLLWYWTGLPCGGSDVIGGPGLVGVSIVALLALLSPIVIMVLDGVSLGGFDIVEGHSLLGASVEIGCGAWAARKE